MLLVFFISKDMFFAVSNMPIVSDILDQSVSLNKKKQKFILPSFL
jgi:hypothetical protein